MKIESTKDGFCNFEELNGGDLFKYENKYFVKAKDTSMCMDCNNESNAMCLYNGKLDYFTPYTQVEFDPCYQTVKITHNVFK